MLWIYKNDGSDFYIDVSDSQGNSHITLIKDSVQTFTDLPTVAPNQFVAEVRGDDTTGFDNYYVKFVTNNSEAASDPLETATHGVLQEGRWEETAKLGIQKQFDYSTMPHVLVRQNDGHFRFAEADGGIYIATTTNATWAQSGTTVTITLNNHGFSAEDRVYIDFLTTSSAAGIDNYYTIVSTATNTFTFTAANSDASGSNGTCTAALQQVLPKWPERTVGDLDTAPDPSLLVQLLIMLYFLETD